MAENESTMMSVTNTTSSGPPGPTGPTGIGNYITVTIFAVIFVAGIVGNGTLMFIVARNKTMRNVPNIFIFSLALGDFLLILTSVPMTATLYFVHSWPYGWHMCKFNYFMQTLSLVVSVFTLTALSGERFMAIIRPMSKRMGNPTQTTLIITGCVWILGVILAIPETILSDMYRAYPSNHSSVFLLICDNFGDDNHWSHEKEGYVHATIIVKFILLFAVPVLIITACYICMAIALVTSGQRMPGEEHGKNSHRKMIAARRKVAIIVLSFAILFIICWFPRHIFIMWYHFDPNDFNSFWHYFKSVGFVLTFINSCVNPVALYFLSAQFRKYYHRYLSVCCRKRQGIDTEQSTTMYNFNSVADRHSTTGQTQC